jgi:iron(III) transport system substrate-binding protein
LLDDFSKQTGITVNLVTGKEEALLQRLQSEGANTPADLLLTSDAGRLAAARQAGVLQAVKSEALAARIPAAYRDPEGYWYGLSVRARPIIYAKDRVKPARALHLRGSGRAAMEETRFACVPPTAFTTNRWWPG